MKKINILTAVVITVLLCLCTIPVYAQAPETPENFYGNVSFQCSPAPAGTTIEAQGTGVLTGIPGNPITTATAGIYGDDGRLIVQGDIANDTEISFFVNGVKADQTAQWSEGETMELDLTVNTVQLTVQNSDGGTVTDPGIGTFNYTCGDDVNLSATPLSPCYYFINWTDDTVADLSSMETTIHMDGNKTVTANFGASDATLTVNAEPAAIGQVAGSGTYPCGTDVDISASTDDPCYYFNGWTGDGIAAPSSASTTVHIDGDKTVTANFAKYEYTLMVEANPADIGQVTGSGTYDCGSLADITAVSTEMNYYFAGWEGEGITDPSLPNTTILIDGDKTVTANFSPYSTVTLCQGWNAFSVPVAPAEEYDTWGEFIAYNNLQIAANTLSFYFNGSSQIWSVISNDYPLKPCDAIYVNLAEASIVTIMPSSTTSIPTKLVYTGWNLIGLASFSDMPVKDALISIYDLTGQLTGYSHIVSPPLCQDSWVYIRDAASGPMMAVGKGYWVWMINSGTLAGFTFTPYLSD